MTKVSDFTHHNCKFQPFSSMPAICIWIAWWLLSLVHFAHSYKQSPILVALCKNRPLNGSFVLYPNTGQVCKTNSYFHFCHISPNLNLEQIAFPKVLFKKEYAYRKHVLFFFSPSDRAISLTIERWISHIHHIKDSQPLFLSNLTTGHNI